MVTNKLQIVTEIAGAERQLYRKSDRWKEKRGKGLQKPESML